MTHNNKLYIQLYSIHGLIRGENLELGRDADTGGQTKYVVELAKALSEHPRVEKVELVTRLVKDKRVSDDYAREIEEVTPWFRIVRIRCGGHKYLRKELLWPHLEEFVDKSTKYIKSQGRLPDVIHGHYADAGFVCMELTKFFGITFVQTGHSLGRDKLRKLLNDGVAFEEIEKRYKIEHRISIEEDILKFADLIITSTNQEIDKQYRGYNNFSENLKFAVLPPGVDIHKFYPHFEESESDDVKKIHDIIENKLKRFFVDVDKPLILTLCRPDKRKNIAGLIKAYGEDKELQKKANLAIFAGIREDIQTMEENEREVLTEILLLMDKYNLYGKMAIPKRHDTEHEVPELYRIAASTGGVFVNAALTEPFGLTLIEAAASGVPIVATDDGGPRDIVKNLKNGVLVDVSTDENIAKGIHELIDDDDFRKKCSENGIENVKKIYTWKAHTAVYIEQLLKVIEEADGEKSDTFAPVGRKLLDMEKLIITDIDHTLIGDDNSSLKEMRELLNNLPDKAGFGVATGRTVDSAFKVLRQFKVPLPIVIISSVGSEIYYNYKGEMIYSTGWDAHISHKWDRQKIVDMLKQFKFLQYQEEETQRKFKISYYTRDDKANLKKVQNVLDKNKIKANVIFSHGQFLDILPYRASKGKAIRYLSYRWNIPHENILVAGDSGNDSEMLKGELLGVVVGNYAPELESLKGSKRVYFSDKTYSAGIIDGIKHYHFFK